VLKLALPLTFRTSLMHCGGTAGPFDPAVVREDAGEGTAVKLCGDIEFKTICLHCCTSISSRDKEELQK
jgi:hypothetical protein